MSHHLKQAARRHHRTAPEPSATALPAMLKSVLVALLITVIAALLLLLAATALLLCTKDPGRYRDAVGLGLLYFCAALGGLLATKLHGGRAPLLCGLAMGIALFLLLSLPALFIRHSELNNAALALLLRCPLLIAAPLGAILSRHSKKKKHRH